ncbi:MAG: peptidase M22 [Clostridia bacterium]|nr:peptidase M22 [Clostridia bacterium]
MADPICFIGIDTSNYTTSVAACDADGSVILNLKKLLEVNDGERGLRQSDAVFAHIKNLPDLLSSAKNILRDYKIVAVGCSSTPRNVEGSYMPCFLVGRDTALSIGLGANVPVFQFSHQEGHVMAAAYSSGTADTLISSPFCAFHVSGGTTEILRVTPGTTVAHPFNIELIGGTSDLNAGQAIDRTGVAMGLTFPCGREMECLSDNCKEKVPKPRVSVKGLNCNLSGLESLAGKLYTTTQSREVTSRFVLDYLVLTFTKLTENLLERYPDTKLLFAGGVMSNKYIQGKLSEHFNALFASPEFSADNAAGISLLCRLAYLN